MIKYKLIINKRDRELRIWRFPSYPMLSLEEISNDLKCEEAIKFFSIECTNRASSEMHLLTCNICDVHFDESKSNASSSVARVYPKKYALGLAAQQFIKHFKGASRWIHRRRRRKCVTNKWWKFSTNLASIRSPELLHGLQFWISCKT